MEGAARAVVAEKREAFRVHPFRARIDAAVAHPRRIADHDVETSCCQYVREMNVEGEEADLALFDAFERAVIRHDPLAQLAAALDVRLAQAAEEVALRRAQDFLLVLV